MTTKQERILEARKHHKTKEQRRAEALVRQDLWNELSPIGKLKRVKARGGEGHEVTVLATMAVKQEEAFQAFQAKNKA